MSAWVGILHVHSHRVSASGWVRPEKHGKAE